MANQILANRTDILRRMGKDLEEVACKTPLALKTATKKTIKGLYRLSLYPFSFLAGFSVPYAMHFIPTFLNMEKSYIFNNRIINHIFEDIECIDNEQTLSTLGFISGLGSLFLAFATNTNHYSEHTRSNYLEILLATNVASGIFEVSSLWYQSAKRRNELGKELK